MESWQVFIKLWRHNDSDIYISLSTVTSEEYKLLHRLNQVTIAKYEDMTALAGRFNEVSQRLNEKCKIKEPVEILNKVFIIKMII